ncbi:hypothetical protein SLEP1_g1898 [Rubroshorea leprosula]|uniref:Protein kinase domain-containing protein n=1 Tax=Rubroshorea leprosula TaxID=152421 RepID=A0AAV5HJR1_9ROSI|nr:hypothetical protein SLEP1_g1898 [Rubroshorea leprosula]
MAALSAPHRAQELRSGDAFAFHLRFICCSFQLPFINILQLSLLPFAATVLLVQLSFFLFHFAATCAALPSFHLLPFYCSFDTTTPTNGTIAIVSRNMRFKFGRMMHVQHLCAFTSDYSTKLGSGALGIVFRGQFPNGFKIVVKLLEKSSERRTTNEDLMKAVRMQQCQSDL